MKIKVKDPFEKLNNKKLAINVSKRYKYAKRVIILESIIVIGLIIRCIYG